MLSGCSYTARAVRHGSGGGLHGRTAAEKARAALARARAAGIGEEKILTRCLGVLACSKDTALVVDRRMQAFKGVHGGSLLCKP
jgi:hypothetical protein